MNGQRVAVVGGGVAGLAAAHRLVERGAEVSLVEAAARLGGTIHTEHAQGFVIEGGPDSFLTEKPWGVALCERLGLRDALVSTREDDRRTYVVRAGRLEPLPEGFLLLAPTDFPALARSRIFSWPGKLRMALDLVLPRGTQEDESLASFVRRRLGREALERVAQPLVGGIYTSDPEQLSLAATMPRFLELEARHRSVILGLRAAGRAAPPAARGGAGARYGLFASLRDGMGGVVTAIAARLPAGCVRLGTGVTALRRVTDGWELRIGGESLHVGSVVLATPAYVASELLAPLDSELGRLLAAIQYASSATVTLAYRTSDLPPLAGFGFVVPAIERRTLLACTYASRKFPGRAPEGHDLVRGFVGGALRPELATLPDAELIAAVRGDIGAIVGIQAEPLFTRVHRYPRAMPQYAVGHLRHVGAIEGRVAALSGLALAGAAYRGVGFPDCVHSGEVAAEALLRP